MEENIIEEESSEQINEGSENNIESEENTTPEQKNKSNWKKLSSELKEARKIIASKDKEINEIKEWANTLYDNEADRPFTQKEIIEEQKTNESLDDIVTFYQKNTEALEYKAEILNNMKEYWMDREKAWKFVKMDITPESTTRKDFSLWKWVTNVKKDLKKVELKDTLSLTPNERKEWRKIHMWI